MKPTEIQSAHIAARDNIPPVLCPSCQAPVVWYYSISNPESNSLYCANSDCKSEAAKGGANGTSFEAAAKALRKAVEREGK